VTKFLTEAPNILHELIRVGGCVSAHTGNLHLPIGTDDYDRFSEFCMHTPDSALRLLGTLGMRNILA
jgi:hypothetical protein